MKSLLEQIWPNKLKEHLDLLLLGESLRENPKTILLSIPVLFVSILWFSLAGNKQATSGAFGHLGITFKILYKHYWRNTALLKVAYWLFSQSIRLDPGSSLPTLLLKKGQIALDLGDLQSAISDIEKGYHLAVKIGDLTQSAYILAHLGRIKIQNGELTSAKKDLETSLHILNKQINKQSTFHLQVWASTAEIGLSEWFLAMGDKHEAALYAEKAGKRAKQYDLKTRLVDIQALIKKIS